MASRSDIVYFGAGPSALPTCVLEKAAQALINYDGSGLSLVEQSHRSALSASIIAQASKNLRHVAQVPGTHEIFYMQGGGTTQFSAVVYNLAAHWALSNPERANKGVKGCCEYLITGGWSSKAAAEAKRLLGDESVNIALDSRNFHPSGEKKFGSIPAKEEWIPKLQSSEDSAFVYYCDNETVDGVEWPAGQTPADLLANEKRIIVADMSSNILSRTIEVSKFGLIFAGAQKNIGSTGITIVIIRKDILELLRSTPSGGPRRNLPVTPIMMDYPTISNAGSLYNTLPIFDVYIASLTMEELISAHGGATDVLKQQESVANEKSALIYDVLDKHPNFFTVVPEKDVRSRMNICFKVLGGGEADFLKGAESDGLKGLKGHRSVGGIRVSNYNAIPLAGVERLISYINQFVKDRA